MCSNAGTKRKSLYAAVKFERPVKWPSLDVSANSTA